MTYRVPALTPWSDIDALLEHRDELAAGDVVNATRGHAQLVALVNVQKMC